MLLYLLIFVIAFTSTLLLTPVVRSFALKIGAVDSPNLRKIHKNPTPRLGGLAIYFGFMIAAVFMLAVVYFLGVKIHYNVVFGILASATMMLLLGFIDDMRGAAAWIKLIFQIIAAGVAVYFGVTINFISNPFSGLVFLGWASIPLTIFWIVGLTNAVNLIDGLDGLAAGIGAIASVTLFFVALRTHQIGTAMLLLSLGGAAAGFLRYNFNPASIFLGDSGSLFIGFVLSAASVSGVLKSTLVIALIIPVLILGVPIFDTATSIVRRVKAKSHIFEADNKHIHHRLLKAGLTQREAVMALYLVCILLSLGALVVTFMSLSESVVFLTVILIAAIVGAYRIKTNLNIRAQGARI